VKRHRHQTGPAKNKVRKSGKFSALKQAPSSHHNPPHNHHKSTSKLPSKKHTIFQNPPQKQPAKHPNPRPSPPEFFFVKLEPKKSISRQE
jgi:hypothetical protein